MTSEAASQSRYSLRSQSKQREIPEAVKSHNAELLSGAKPPPRKGRKTEKSEANKRQRSPSTEAKREDASNNCKTGSAGGKEKSKTSDFVGTTSTSAGLLPPFHAKKKSKPSKRTESVVALPLDKHPLTPISPAECSREKRDITPDVSDQTSGRTTEQERLPTPPKTSEPPKTSSKPNSDTETTDRSSLARKLDDEINEAEELNLSTPANLPSCLDMKGRGLSLGDPMATATAPCTDESSDYCSQQVQSSKDNKEVPDMVEHVEGLFQGSRSVFTNNFWSIFLRTRGIRKIYTILRSSEVEHCQDPDRKDNTLFDTNAEFERTWLKMGDHPFDNLLKHLPKITSQIRGDIEAGQQVYVHCNVGVSRSVSVVIAYLIRYESLSYWQAEDQARQKRPKINPNCGFIQQLLIWEKICNIPEDKWDEVPEYRFWKMTRDVGILAANWDAIYRGSSIILRDANNKPCKRNMLDFIETFPMDGDDTISEPEGDYYRCSRCKIALAPVNRAISFTQEHSMQATSPTSDCTHIFLSNPFEWMRPQIDIDSIGGKLFCPNCDEEHCVGEYCWLGVQCQGEECAEIMAPGLALFRKSRRPSAEKDSGVELFKGQRG